MKTLHMTNGKIDFTMDSHSNWALDFRVSKRCNITCFAKPPAVSTKTHIKLIVAS